MRCKTRSLLNTLHDTKGQLKSIGTQLGHKMTLHCGGPVSIHEYYSLPLNDTHLIDVSHWFFNSQSNTLTIHFSNLHYSKTTLTNERNYIPFP